MKYIAFIITTSIIMTSCENKTERQQVEVLDDIHVANFQTSDTIEELTTTNSGQIIEY